MKIRSAFVSNSSSASFILSLEHIDEETLFKVLYPEIVCTKTDESDHCLYVEDAAGWSKEISNDFIYFSTSMDNFSYVSYLMEKLNISGNDILTVEEDYAGTSEDEIEFFLRSHHGRG